ncbi:Uncharacterised protein [Mycobacteroides abscessus subsp. abscessus]|nr:Uncharacterised protein [Mycobacteroides abscessus subsp. abscessus]
MLCLWQPFHPIPILPIRIGGNHCDLDVVRAMKYAELQ